MRSLRANVLMSTLAGVAILVHAGMAAADDGLKTYAVKDESTTTGPNRTLLHSGIWTLGIAYVPALIVATQSSRDADRRLYVPVAGPWMDLANRGKCPTNETCNRETSNKVLIAVDGVFQGIGALDIIGAFLFPETRTVTVGSSKKSEKVRAAQLGLRVVPARIGGAYGLMAAGSF